MGVRVDGQLIMNSTEIADAIAVAVAAGVQTALQQQYPVGSLYFNTSNTNPSTVLGFGTWAAYGAGRAIVGFDAGDVDFDTDEETGGTKTHTLVAGEVPNLSFATRVNSTTPLTNANVAAGTAGSPGTQATNTGGGGAHNNQMKYIATRVWKRTA